jgi:hypothetical protein
MEDFGEVVEVHVSFDGEGGVKFGRHESLKFAVRIFGELKFMKFRTEKVSGFVEFIFVHLFVE